MTVNVDTPVMPVRLTRLKRDPVIRLTWLVVLLAAWQIGVSISQINPVLVPSPGDVARAFAADIANGSLLGYLLNTLHTLGLGAGIGVVLGFLLASFALISESWGKALLELTTSMFNPLPAIALLPLAILWFGLGTGAIVFVVVHSVVWTVATNVHAGFQAVPKVLRRVGNNMGLTKWQTITHIAVPAAVPSILSGVRVAWSFAWRTVIAAELVYGASGSSGGLGWYIYTSQYFLQTASMFAGLGVIVLVGLGIEMILFRGIEKVTVEKWLPSTT